ADELVGALGDDLGRALSPLLRVRRLLLFVLLVLLVGDDEPLLQNLVEAGLDVLVLGLLLFLFFFVGGLGGGRATGLFLVLVRFLIEDVLVQRVVVERILVVEVLEIGLVEILGLLELLV